MEFEIVAARAHFLRLKVAATALTSARSWISALARRRFGLVHARNCGSIAASHIFSQEHYVAILGSLKGLIPPDKAVKFNK